MGLEPVDPDLSEIEKKGNCKAPTTPSKKGIFFSAEVL
jgi:hypothetical protein